MISAFSNCDAGTSLAIGSTIALVIVAIYYMIDKIVSFKEIMSSITQGFKTMVPAILILTFAWTIAGIMGAKGGYLDAQAFVQNNMEMIPATVQAFFPAIFFALACVVAFSTGTSWGTFGILIPIVTDVFKDSLANVGEGGSIPAMVIICISACLAGAVCGDHCSPISDTTIMASTGAQSDHVAHVSTQLPYALTVAGVSLVGYLLAGFVQNVFVVLGVSLALMIATLFVIKAIVKKKA